MIPKPPAFETAEANCARAMKPHWGLEHRIVHAEQLGDTGAEWWRSLGTDPFNLSRSFRGRCYRAGQPNERPIRAVVGTGRVKTCGGASLVEDPYPT